MLHTTIDTHILLFGSSGKKEKMGLGPTKVPLRFESDVDHRLDTKYNTDLDFPIYPFI